MIFVGDIAHPFSQTQTWGMPFGPGGTLKGKVSVWDIPLDQTQRFTEIIQACVDMDSQDMAVMSRRAREYALSKVTDRKVIARNRELFSGIAHLSAEKTITETLGDIHVRR
mgnify:CR=1 FL=1